MLFHFEGSAPQRVLQPGILGWSPTATATDDRTAAPVLDGELISSAASRAREYAHCCLFVGPDGIRVQAARYNVEFEQPVTNRTLEESYHKLAATNTSTKIRAAAYVLLARSQRAALRLFRCQ